MCTEDKTQAPGINEGEVGAQARDREGKWECSLELAAGFDAEALGGGLEATEL